MVARCSRASASVRKVFWMMLNCCGGGFGALGCMVSADLAEGSAIVALAPSPVLTCDSFASDSFACGSLAVMSMAMVLSDRFRRCAFASGDDGWAGASVPAAGAALA